MTRTMMMTLEQCSPFDDEDNDDDDRDQNEETDKHSRDDLN